MNIFKRAAFVTGAAGAMALAVAAPSFAANVIQAVDEYGGSTVQYNIDTKQWRTCDLAADGHHAEGQLRYQNPAGGWETLATEKEYGGAGSCLGWANVPVPGSNTVEIRSATYEGTTKVEGWTSWVAS
jgi:hypothetical protein